MIVSLSLVNRLILMENNCFKNELLIQYGFIYNDGKYIYEKIIYDQLKLVIIIKNNKIESKIIDMEFNDEYLPYNQEYMGLFSSQIYDLANNIINDIINKCSLEKNNRNNILEYVKDKYQTIPEYPWNNDYDCTLKVDKKWYGLIMKINSKKLGINIDQEIDIINLKAVEEDIKTLVDYQVVFPAYHMNKKYWYTVIINQVNLDILYKLIDNSYNLVKKKG